MGKREPDNLDLDSRRALELGFGVHYGDYKAVYPHTREMPEPEKEVPMESCLECGTLFPATRRGRKFCSDNCRVRYRKYTNAPPDPNKVRLSSCAICGGKITNRKMRRYCCAVCAEMGRLKVKAAWNEKQKAGVRDGETMGE